VEHEIMAIRFTSADLELLADGDGKRYEIIDGELYVSRQPHLYHQVSTNNVGVTLSLWNDEVQAGLVIPAPGLVFAEDDDVVPDVVWISDERLANALDDSGHLRAAPEIVIEVLSPGAANERRDREAKLRLYGRHGVREYWIINWQRREVEVYRRAELTLQFVGTLFETDTLTSPLLPGFSCTAGSLFAGIPRAAN
jgi:Uma2 family endonuclease